MLFSLNYSTEMAELIHEGAIQVDRVKCPDWPEMIAQGRAVGPVYVHFPLLAGQGLIPTERLEAVARLREETDTPYVNTHIAPRISDLRDAQDPEAVYDAVMRDVMQLVDYFGAEAVIAENIPYPEGPNREPKPLLASDAGVIRRVIEDSGVGLLLDIGHARRVAEHLAIDPRRYMAELPGTRLREVHITGLGYTPEGHRTDHMPMRDEDWELLAWVLDHVHSGRWAAPWSVSCEYGGVGQPFKWRSRKDVIAHEAPRMLEMVRAALPAARGTL
jgi:uncharacterized protein (UPF0276 family)